MSKGSHQYRNQADLLFSLTVIIMDMFEDDEFVNYNEFSGDDDGESSIEGGDDCKGHQGGQNRKGEIPQFKSRLQASAERKRQDRNQREQQRSFRITKQIDQLKELLISSGVKVTNNLNTPAQIPAHQNICILPSFYHALRIIHPVYRHTLDSH